MGESQFYVGFYKLVAVIAIIIALFVINKVLFLVFCIILFGYLIIKNNPRKRYDVPLLRQGRS